MSSTSHAGKHARTHESSTIEELKLERDAWASRASALQARLLSTIDALDHARIRHERELAEAAHTHDTLQGRVSAAQMALAISEAERDDMRDAVLQLVEKVEICNDYSQWPHSSILMSSFADPPDPAFATASSHTIPEHLEAFRGYAASVIAALRAECDCERTAHALSRADLGARVAVLEAMVAQRELELERSASCAFCRRVATMEPAPGSARPNLTREEAIRLLEQSAARNRSLSAENEGLAARLGRARAALLSPTASPTLQLTHEGFYRSESEKRSDLNRRATPSPPPARKQTRKKFPRPPTPHRPRLQAALTTASSDDENGWSRRPSDGDKWRETSRMRVPPSPQPQPFGRYDSLEQISMLDLNETPPSMPEETTQLQKQSLHDASSCEQECIRLRSALAVARREIELLQSAPRTWFQTATPIVHNLNQPATTNPSQLEPQPDPFGDDLSERSMDLASPLQPTLILGYPLSPPSVPLPPSPAISTAPAPSSTRSSPVLPVFSLDPDADTAELERVRDALEEAEARLRTQDTELLALREALQAVAHTNYRTI